MCIRDSPRTPPKRPTSFKHAKKINGVCLLAFSPPKGSRGLKMAPSRPTTAPIGAQESPKTAPRAPRNAPRAGPRLHVR
eukprot:8167405-Pyramimonas_sp.AAC.1